jgi:nucleotide-binding universal stress UspA family protein
MMNDEDDTMKRIRRVLYATDFSAASRRAFTTAVTIARSAGARMTIVHVIAPVIAAVPQQYLDAVTLDQLEKRAQQWSTRQLNKLADHARRAGLKAGIELRSGDPVGQIIRAARTGRADLIVVGTHGRRGLPKFLLGSVAERVIKMAPCAVVTVKGR